MTAQVVPEHSRSAHPHAAELHGGQRDGAGADARARRPRLARNLPQARLPPPPGHLGQLCNGDVRRKRSTSAAKRMADVAQRLMRRCGHPAQTLQARVLARSQEQDLVGCR